MKPKQKVKIEWSAGFAYAIGLLVTDGNLSKDGRHISFTSKDIELINNFVDGLGISCHVGMKARGYEREKKYFVIQFSDVHFYSFLQTIGLTTAKTFTVEEVKIPDEFFFDFLRGHFDGDGTFYSYFDPRWKSSFMFYLVFLSASQLHIDWLRGKIFAKVGVRGHVTTSKNSSVYQLKYAKKETLKLLTHIYYDSTVMALTRKRQKIEDVLKSVKLNQFKHARVL